jgi:malate dehydrogenase (oxaloacetate-decarboxylating)(NADP+)
MLKPAWQSTRKVDEAAKPVMEGKGCLFKKFAGINVFDIEDIKAPECFYIEKKLRERMKIHVFHDDQHRTAIISSTASSMKVATRRWK